MNRELIVKIMHRFIVKFPVPERWGFLKKKRVIGISAGVLFFVFLVSLSHLRQESTRKGWAVAQKGSFIVDLIETGENEILRRPDLTLKFF